MNVKQIIKFEFIFVVTTLLFNVTCEQSFAQDTTKVQQENKQGINFGFNNQLVTKYVPKVGVQIGEGYANQSKANLAYAGFNIFAWGNYGIPDDRFTGIIYGMQYKLKLPLKSKKVDLYNTVALNRCIFPTADKENWLVDYFFIVNGRIQTTFHYSHVFSAGDVDHGDRLHAVINYPMKYKFFKLEPVLIPSISSAYHWNFYNKTGLAHITFGLKNKLVFSKFSVSAFANYQHSFESVKAILESGFYGGLCFSYWLRI
jgi:hypothetical protein